MTYHTSINNRIPEGPITYSMYGLYATTNYAYKPNISHLATNCNMYLIKAIDSTDTSGKVCCIPIKQLETFVNVNPRPDNYNNLNYKKSLFLMADKESLLKKYRLFYKPIFTKPAVTNKGWEVTIDDKEYKDNKDIWLSNHDLNRLIKSYIVLLEDSHYMGVVFLSCFDKKSKSLMENIYRHTALKKQMKEEMDKYSYLTGCIVSYSHWSSIVIDTKTKTVLHYCSGGNDPQKYEPNNNIMFYSTSKGFQKTSPEGKLCDRYISKYYLFKDLISQGYKILMNVESSQILSGECGIYASLFIILYILFKPSCSADYCKIYNSFGFLGDKMMGLYKDLLFWREDKMCAETKSVKAEILNKWSLILSEQSNILATMTNTTLEELSGLTIITN